MIDLRGNPWSESTPFLAFPPQHGSAALPGAFAGGHTC